MQLEVIIFSLRTIQMKGFKQIKNRVSKQLLYEISLIFKIDKHDLIESTLPKVEEPVR